MIKSVCTYCNITLGNLDDSQSQVTVSHGVCSGCLLAVFGDYIESIEDIVDAINSPMLAIDRYNSFTYANRQACAFMGMELEAIIGRFVGDLFGCSCFKQSEECGASIDCQYCVVASAIHKTFTIGRPQEIIPTNLHPEITSVAESIKSIIYTQKYGDVVLLQFNGA